ncbi:MAG: sec-independent protein translocase protein TatA [Myxococcota bacterium]|jgi:sec-independent protein translocase protein TatA
MFSISQLVVVLLIVLVLFGAGKVPNLLGDIGKGIKNFRKNIKDEDLDTKKINEKNNKE